MTDLTFRLTLCRAGEVRRDAGGPAVYRSGHAGYVHGIQSHSSDPGKARGLYRNGGHRAMPQRDSHLEGRGDGAGCWGGDVLFSMSSTDMPMALIFFLSTGVAVGFGHCIGMCGPIVVALGLKSPGERPLLPHLLYNAGRIVTYAVLGGVVGASGSFTGLAAHVMGVQKAVMIGTGASDHHDRDGHGWMAPRGADFCERFSGQRADHPGVQTAEPSRSSSCRLFPPRPSFRPPALRAGLYRPPGGCPAYHGRHIPRRRIFYRSRGYGRLRAGNLSRR